MRTLALVPAVAILTVLTAAPAVAGRQVHHDPAQDVVAWHDSTQTGTITPGARQADITSLTTVYADRRLRLRAKFRYVATSEDFWTGWDIRTADRLVQVQLRRIGHGAFLSFHDLTGDLERRASCPGASFDISSRQDAMRVTIPRRCFGGGRWVRTGLEIHRDTGPGDYQADDARLDGEIIANRATSRLGPRISYN